MVMLHINLKEITNAATWLRKYFDRTPPMTLGFKMQLFQNMVVLHNKLKRMEPRPPCMPIFSLHIHPQPAGSDLMITNSECGHVGYQIKGKELQTNIEANTLTLLTPLTSGSG